MSLVDKKIEQNGRSHNNLYKKLYFFISFILILCFYDTPIMLNDI